MDSHPQIDIISTPSLECPNPVYNCVRWCLQATDYLTTPGDTAYFYVAFFDPSNYADGIPIRVAGRDFETGPNGYESFKWSSPVPPPLTLVEIADNFFAMLQANYSFFEDWDVVRTSSPGFETIVANAREEGFVNPFDFDFPVVTPPLYLPLNGTDPEYKENYRIVVEVWKCVDGVLTEKLYSNAYEPDADGNVCFDIAGTVSSYLSTGFPGLQPNDDSVYIQPDMCFDVCLRYGQIYADDETTCDAIPRYFETSSPVALINSAFQKEAEVESIETGVPLMDPFCYQGSPTRFLTDYPSGLKVCPDSLFWLYYNLDIDLSAFSNPEVYPFYRFRYTDGSVSSPVQGSRPLSGNGCFAVPAGEYQLSYLSPFPLKTIASIETTIILIDLPSVALIISETFVLEIDQTACCCREFYFLNEKGGFDTIRLNCEQDRTLNLESVDICSIEKCEGDILKGGKAEANRKAFETYTVFTKFNSEYLDLDWLRQFLKSPIRYVREDGKIFKIKLLSDEVQIFSNEEILYFELQYILSFELNTQKA